MLDYRIVKFDIYVRLTGKIKLFLFPDILRNTQTKRVSLCIKKTEH